VGLALAERISRERFGPELFSHYTYVIAGDGDMQEGITHEAASLAGHWGLSKLIILYDDNGISIDGPTALSFSEDVCARYAAYGFATKRIDGHDMAAIDAALAWAKNQDQPVLIACRTTIGFGAGAKAGTADAHGAPLGPTEIATARQNLAWPHAPFDIPEDILNAWRKIGARHFDAVGAWDNRFDAAPEALRQQWIHEQRGVDTATLDRAITAAMAVLAPPARHRKLFWNIWSRPCPI
jgi:transketolase